MSETNGNHASAFLSREAILAAPDLAREEVDCPEWGGKVLVRELTAQERLDLGLELARALDVRPGTSEDDAAARAQAAIPRLSGSLLARIAALGIIDEHGVRVFPDDQIAALGGKGYAPVNRCAEAILRLSAMTKESVAELGKDSTATTTSPSPTS
jgi:hypothetical protein